MFRAHMCVIYLFIHLFIYYNKHTAGYISKHMQGLGVQVACIH